MLDPGSHSTQLNSSLKALCGVYIDRKVTTHWPTISLLRLFCSRLSAPQKFLYPFFRHKLLHQQCLCHFRTSGACTWCPCPWLCGSCLVSWMQQTSTFLRDSVSTTSQTLPLRVLTLSVPTLNFHRCLLDSPQWPDPASHTWQKGKPETLPTELLCLLAPPISDSTVVFAIKDFGTTVFTGSPA